MVEASDRRTHILQHARCCLVLYDGEQGRSIGERRRTISRETSFPTTLDAARSTSTSPGLNSRSTFSSLRADAACFTAEAAVVLSDLASEAFQPDSATAERLLEAALTLRIASAFRCCGLGPAALALPLGSEMESFEARESARSSGETAEDGLEDFVAVRVVRAAAARVFVVGGIVGVDAESGSRGEEWRRMKRERAWLTKRTFHQHTRSPT